MRIAIFTDNFFPGVGGMERAANNLCLSLIKEGHEVMLVCPKYRKSDDSQIPYPVVRIPSIAVSSNDYMALAGLSAKVKKKVIAFKPDIIHCQSVWGCAKVGQQVANKLDIPFIMTLHTKYRDAFRRSIHCPPIVSMLIKNMVRRVYRSDEVTAVCQDMVRELKDYGYNGECKVVRNGAEFTQPQDIAECRRKGREYLGFSQQEEVYLFCGHLVKFKNLDFIFDAITELKNRGRKFKMLFVGSGIDDKYYVKLTKKLGLEEYVKFTGVIKDRELISSLYSASDLFLFPSSFDNDPLTLVEAAIHNVPSVTIAGTGSCERIIDGVSGYVIENNPTAMANVIEVAMDNPEERAKICKNAALLIPKSWDSTASEYIEEYKMAIDFKLNEKVELIKHSKGSLITRLRNRRYKYVYKTKKSR